MDRVPINPRQKVRISLISTNSEWKQDIKLQAKGSIKVAGQVLRRGVLLWEGTMPTEVELIVEAKTDC